MDLRYKVIIIESMVAEKRYEEAIIEIKGMLEYTEAVTKQLKSMLKLLESAC